MKTRFIFSILTPVFIVLMVSMIFSIKWLLIIMLIFLIDGVIGLLRSQVIPKLKDKIFTKEKMIIVKPNIWFLKQHNAINLFSIVFIKPSGIDNYQKVINHELIHLSQGYETGYLMMYLIYFLEGLAWTVKLLFTLPKELKKIECSENLSFFERLQIAIQKCYTHICFEQEARKYETSEEYVNNRDSYAWIPFLYSDDKN